MKIVKLKAENIKKLVAVEIEPTGAVVKITGANGAGKTAVLDAIYWALGGGDSVQQEPIRTGEDHAYTSLDLGDVVVIRNIHVRKEGDITSSVVVETKDGLRYKSPQSFLDSLTGRLWFDPAEFCRQEPKKQVETLRQLTGIDFTELDQARAKLYADRAQVNKDANRLEVAFEQTVIPGAPENETDLTQIMDQMKAANELRDTQQKLFAEAERVRVAIGSAERALRESGELIRKLEDHLQKARDEYIGHQDTLGAERQRLEDELQKAGEIIVPDLSLLQRDFWAANAQNKAFFAAKSARDKKEDLKGQLTAARKRSEDTTRSIQNIDAMKEDMLAKAQFPLPGLGFGVNGVTYNNLPLEQASAAEQLRVSMAMAMAMNPKLRVIRITDGSLLDSNSMAVIEEMCSAQDFQCWLEVVDESGKIGIVIEDGKVKAVN